MRRCCFNHAMCVVVCLPAALGAQTVRGTVTEEKSGQPLPSVTVRLEDVGQRVVMERQTSAGGEYEISAPRPGTYRVLFLRPGYRPLLTAPIELVAGQTRTVPVSLGPVAAVGLDTVVAEGERVPPYLQEFWRRRHTESGTFLTEQDIERFTPTRATDLAYHLPGFRLMYDERHRRIINNSKYNGLCPPLVFVDGLFVGNAQTYDFDDVAPHDIAAVEAYSREASMPVELNRPGSACGVIVLWTKH